MILYLLLILSCPSFPPRIVAEWMGSKKCGLMIARDRERTLYRPQIWKEMVNSVEDAFNKGGPAGIMIRGPQRIGKSHSALLNLVRTLQYDSRCKYLVTFIPDYEKWKDLYTLICSSFGTSLSALLWSSSSGLVSQSKRHYTFVIAMDLILRGMKKKWVLVFDQINRLFTRFVTKAASQIYLGCSLSFPFDVIFNMMQGDHIFSIVPASAKNEATYKERHSGFEEYNHLQHGFGRNQARLWSSGYTEWLRKSLGGYWWGDLAGVETDFL